MARLMLITTALITTGIIVLSGCDSQQSPTEPQPGSDILEKLRDYQSWAVIDATIGPDPLLASAHGVNNGFIRIIYANKSPNNEGIYPEGSIIVKELRNQEGIVVGPLTAMIKRSGNFNPDGNGWEWVMTSSSRDSIAAHGDNATMATCAGCHNQATNGQAGNDWVFRHPKEFTINDLLTIAQFTTWDSITANRGPDPFLGAAHGVNDNFERVVWMNYRTTPFQNRYPTGLIIVKELRDSSGNSVGPLTIMVKRGGNFNLDGNGWEWIMTNATRDSILTRGDNATAAGGLCANCHAQANTGTNGIDWVFTRP